MSTALAAASWQSNLTNGLFRSDARSVNCFGKSVNNFDRNRHSNVLGSYRSPLTTFAGPFYFDRKFNHYLALLAQAKSSARLIKSKCVLSEFSPPKPRRSKINEFQLLGMRASVPVEIREPSLFARFNKSKFKSCRSGYESISTALCLANFKGEPFVH